MSTLDGREGHLHLLDSLNGPLSAVVDIEVTFQDGLASLAMTLGDRHQLDQQLDMVMRQERALVYRKCTLTSRRGAPAAPSACA